MNKKLISTVTAFALILGGGAMMPREAAIFDTVVQVNALAEFDFEKNDDGTLTLKGYNGAGGDVVVPETYSGRKVTKIGWGVFGSDTITSVTLPDSITEMGYSVFVNCCNLKSVKLSKNLKNIGDSAFFNCSSLSSITLPDSLTKIGDDAFGDCVSLTEINIPQNVEELKQYAFSGCSSLKKVNFSNKKVPLKTIEKCAFSGCSSLESVSIPDGVTMIAVQAFTGCHNLASVDIPNSVTLVGSFAFESTSKDFKSVTIPKSVTTIGSEAFGYYYSPNSGIGREKNPDFKIYGYLDTAAEDYALENGFEFIPIEDPYEPGDANKDGKVNMKDLVIVQRYLNGWAVDIDITLCDLNGDNKVNMKDYVALQRQLNGWTA